MLAFWRRLIPVSYYCCAHFDWQCCWLDCHHWNDCCCHLGANFGLRHRRLRLNHYRRRIHFRFHYRWHQNHLLRVSIKRKIIIHSNDSDRDELKFITIPFYVHSIISIFQLVRYQPQTEYLLINETVGSGYIESDLGIVGLISNSISNQCRSISDITQ